MKRSYSLTARFFTRQWYALPDDEALKGTLGLIKYALSRFTQGLCAAQGGATTRSERGTEFG